MLTEIGLSGICGTDTHILRNADQPVYRDSLPFTLGHEVTGRICGMGKKAGGSMFCNESLSEGDRIALYVFLPCGNCWWERKFGNNHTLVCSQPRKGYFGNPLQWPHFTAGWGEYIYIQPGSWVWRLPETMAYETAVLIEPLSMALRAVQKAMALPALKNLQTLAFGGMAAVLGSGTIGLLTAISLKIAGAGCVVLIGGPKESLSLAEELGAADYTFDIDAGTPQERIAGVKEISDGGWGADAVFETAGDPEAFAESLEMTRRLGTCVELGCLIDDGSSVPINVARLITSKDITVYGVSNQSPQDMEKALKVLQIHGDRFAFSRLVTHIFALQDIQKAIRLAQSRRKKAMKLAFKGAGYP
jgi:threonine dehydrogenase-like Zn-dependent dehydrogenase